MFALSCHVYTRKRRVSLPDWYGWQASLVYWTESYSPSDCSRVLSSKKSVMLTTCSTWVAGKTVNKKRATCLATLLQNELNSNVARFTTHEKKTLRPLIFVARQVGTWVVKRTTSLLTRFAAMLQNRLHVFGFPVYYRTRRPDMHRIHLPPKPCFPCSSSAGGSTGVAAS